MTQRHIECRIGHFESSEVFEIKIIPETKLFRFLESKVTLGVPEITVKTSFKWFACRDLSELFFQSLNKYGGVNGEIYLLKLSVEVTQAQRSHSGLEIIIKVVKKVLICIEISSTQCPETVEQDRFGLINIISGKLYRKKERREERRDKRKEEDRVGAT